MFSQRLFLVWVGILILAGTFLLGQESWPPASPRIEGYSNSGCLPGSGLTAEGDQYPWCGGDGMEITAEGRTIHIVHRNATYNCCPDDIEVILTELGNVLLLTETEILTIPCACLCCYDVESTVVDLSPGMYVIEYCWHDYETGDECHTEEVLIE
jgi:hypothetical protein